MGAVIVEQKKWYESKVVWLNVFTTLSLLGMLGGSVKLSPQQAEVIGVIVALSNIVLRVWFTGAPVTDQGAEAAETGDPK